MGVAILGAQIRLPKKDRAKGFTTIRSAISILEIGTIMCLLMGPTCSKMGRVSKEMFEEGNKEKEYIGISMEMSIKESGKTI